MVDGFLESRMDNTVLRRLSLITASLKAISLKTGYSSQFGDSVHNQKQGQPI